jgi:hypothetical protein
MKFGIIVVYPSLPASVRFMKISSVTVIFYVKECMNMYLYLSHLLADLGEIRCIISPHNVIEPCDFCEKVK